MYNRAIFAGLGQGDGGDEEDLWAGVSGRRWRSIRRLPHHQHVKILVAVGGKSSACFLITAGDEGVVMDWAVDPPVETSGGGHAGAAYDVFAHTSHVACGISSALGRGAASTNVAGEDGICRHVVGLALRGGS